MNQDCYFEIGHSHTICEDYALAGKINDGLSYAIVCDGCSSSNYVDVGARILAHSAKEYLCSYYKNRDCVPDNIDAYEAGLSIITRAAPHAKVLMLPYTSLDSTLIITLADKTGFSQTFFYGDGGLLYKDDGELYYTEVMFPSGAPFYLSYLLEPMREQGYIKEFGREAVFANFKVEEDRIEQVEDGLCDDEDSSNFLRSLSGEGMVTEWSAIVSDGIRTYQSKDEMGISQDRPFVDAIKKVSNYKGFKGQFVKRRMKRMRQNCEKDGINHYDDISIATIYMGD